MYEIRAFDLRAAGGEQKESAIDLSALGLLKIGLGFRCECTTRYAVVSMFQD